MNKIKLLTKKGKIRVMSSFKTEYNNPTTLVLYLQIHGNS